MAVLEVRCLNKSSLNLFGRWGQDGAAAVASVRSHQELSPCCTEPVPAGSVMDLPLAKAEPVSKAGGVSVRT